MGMFDSPQAQAVLMGLLQGATQSAMPSRVPLGFGAAMGMIGAGALKGKADYQAAARAQALEDEKLGWMRQQHEQQGQQQQALQDFLGAQGQDQPGVIPSPQGPMPNGGVTAPMEGQGQPMPKAYPFGFTGPQFSALSKADPASLASAIVAQRTAVKPDYTVGDVRYSGATNQVIAGAPKPSAPTTRTYESGADKVTETWSPTTQAWTETARAPIQQPQRPYTPLTPEQLADEKKKADILNNSRVGAEQTGAEAINPDSVDYVAQQYMITGQLPPLGMGKDAAKMRRQIIDKAAAIERETGSTGADAAMRHAQNKARASALGRVTGTAAMIGSFEQTAQKNADIVLSLIEKGTAKSGVPVLNAWIQAGRRSVAGDPNVSAFDTALTTFKNEYARVVNSATGGGVTTDSARQEIESILNAAQTPEQIKAAISVAKRDMANRTSSLDEAKDTLSQQIRGGAPQANAPKPSSGWSVQRVP